MGNLIKILNEKLEATDALIFYKSSLNDGAYVEHRPIRNGAMCAGKPLEVSVIMKLLKTVDKYAHGTTSMVSLHGEIPDNLLYASTNIDSYKLVWYRKPEKRMFYFSERLGIPNGEVLVPGLIYVTNGNSLSMYAFKGKKPKRLLYQAPFFNTDTSVCLGNGKLSKPKEQTYMNWMSYWEELFWKTEFSHIIGKNPVKGNLSIIMKECITCNKPFPMDSLIAIKTTLQSLYKNEI